MQITFENDFKELELFFPIINGNFSMSLCVLLKQRFEQAGLAITPEQWTVLSSLWGKDGVTQQSLCNTTLKDRPSMTRIIDNLEKQEFVTRHTPVTDRRTNLIFLTEQGKNIQEKVNHIVFEMMRYDCYKNYTSNELIELRRLLKMVYENVYGSLKECGFRDLWEKLE